MRVKFTKTYTVKNPADPAHYKEGKVYLMSEASAAHFIRRGLAEPVGVKPKDPPKAPEAETDPPKEPPKDPPKG